MSFKKAITKGEIGNTKELILIEKLNKLFYLESDHEAEAKMVHMIMKKNGDAKERVGLHASSLIAHDKDFCFRALLLSLHYKQIQSENVPIKLKRIFEEGNAIHEKWQRLFLRGKLGKPSDMDKTQFFDDFGYLISFTPDAILTFGNKKLVVEIKSVNTYQFKTMKSHPSGEKQLQLYMHLTGIHEGFVLCDDKNTQDFKVFYAKYDKEKVAPFIERIEAIGELNRIFIEEKKVPKRVCESSTCKRAAQCNMKDACFNIGMGRIKL